MEQLIISVGRQFGSGGHEIAEELSRRFQIPLYDKNLLSCIAEEKEVAENTLEKYDERARNMLLSRTVQGYSNSPEDNLLLLQFEYLENLAKTGKSFVVVGRCAEDKLKSFQGLVSVFVLGDIDVRTNRIVNKYKLSEKEAVRMIKREDKNRRLYHNYYCGGKWGDAGNYDMTINSSTLGVEETTNLLEIYIKKRQQRVE